MSMAAKILFIEDDANACILGCHATLTLADLPVDLGEAPHLNPGRVLASITVRPHKEGQ